MKGVIIVLNEKVIKLLNEQVNKELYSAYLYLDMANFYTNKGLNGFAQWFKVQAKEEVSHAMKFQDYLQDNGLPVELDAIAKPHGVFEDLKAPLEMALEHEKFVTKSIHTIYEEAAKVKDYRTMEFLNWFVKEQLEEEKNAEDLITRYELSKNSLFVLDHYLGKREDE